MRNKLAFLLAFLSIGLLNAGCKEKPVTIATDVDNPKIIMSSPAVVPLGQYVPVESLDSIPVDIRFEDDMELRDFTISISRRKDLNFLKTNTDGWKESVFGALEGTVDAINYFIYTPFDPSAGPYEFKVTAYDQEGKSSEVITYLYMTNNIDTEFPEIQFINPNPAVIDTFTIGDDIIMQAFCTDNNAIVDVTARVRDAFTNEVLSGSTIQIDTLYVQPYALDTFVNIPAGTVPGMYKVEVYATDPVGNHGYNLDSIYIKPN